MNGASHPPSSIIQTKYGPVQGFLYSSKHAKPPKSAEIFLSVPYAQPTTGDLRMERPRSPIPWSSDKPRQCKEFGPGSVSLNPSGVEVTREDSLILNVFRPLESAKEGGGRPRPVLVYVHGGGFCSGCSREYGYEQWVENFVLPQGKEGVVFVTVQYRLGPLGFLSSTTEAMPGNMGLWDQAKALQFVHENISAFGGDPARVTFWGLSAGAASVSLLSLSPRTREMISSSIEMSGCAMAVWAMSRRDVLDASREFMDALGWDPSPTEEVPGERKEGDGWKKMLKEAPLEEIRRASFNMVSWE